MPSVTLLFKFTAKVFSVDFRFSLCYRLKPKRQINRSITKSVPIYHIHKCKYDIPQNKHNEKKQSYLYKTNNYAFNAYFTVLFIFIFIIANFV